MRVTITPSPLHGAVHAIPSKSDLHRLLICAALADGPTSIDLYSEATLSNDILATINCLRSLGATITLEHRTLHVIPKKERASSPKLNCEESGSTLRFLLPVAAVHADNPSFTGTGRLPERPVSDLLNAMAQNGITATAGKLPFTFHGTLTPGTYALPGNVSSQYITGLLLALPVLSGDSEIKLTTPLQSASYVDITIHSLEAFGIRVIPTETGWLLPGNQQFHSPGRLVADGDWSNGDFWLVAGALLEEGLTIQGLNMRSPQGDKATLSVLEDFGATVSLGEQNQFGLQDITVTHGTLKATTVDLANIPDALPILAILATAAEGETRFINGERLRLKESDRIHSVWHMITSLGGTATEQPDGLLVKGAPLTGGTVLSYNDHRIVMAAAIGALRATGPVHIEGAEAVHKSYPSFFEDYQMLGGNSNGI